MPTPPAGNNSDTLANALFASLVGATNAELPEINLFDDEHTIPWDEDSDVFKPVEKLEVSELVKNFAAMMEGFKVLLKEEFDNGRITGGEYSKTFIALTQGAMQGAVQFTLGKDQAFWMAAKTQADAISSHNQNEVIRLEAMLRRATYALTKLKLASEDSAFGGSNYTLENILPAQKTLVTEQGEAQRAQTLEDRSDTIPVTGVLGRQKDLYDQQVKSYAQDARLKAARVFTDFATANMTINDAASPTNADNTTQNAVLLKVKEVVDATIP